MTNLIEQLIAFLRQYDGINDKAKLAKLVSDNFHLTKDRSVYYCKDFAVRFSSSATPNFGNTVLSLSNLQKFDDRPFIVCLVINLLIRIRLSLNKITTLLNIPKRMLFLAARGKEWFFTRLHFDFRVMLTTPTENDGRLTHRRYSDYRPSYLKIRPLFVATAQSTSACSLDS